MDASMERRHRTKLVKAASDKELHTKAPLRFWDKPLSERHLLLDRSDSSLALSHMIFRSSNRQATYSSGSKLTLKPSKTPDTIMELNAERLELMLCSHNSGDQFVGLRAKYISSPTGVLLHQEYEDIAIGLSEILSKKPSDSDHVHKDIMFCHESTGICHYRKGDYESAIVSFTKVLWLQKAAANSLYMGQTQHRLALAYEKLGCTTTALDLLEKARKAIKKSGVHDSHPSYIAVTHQTKLLKSTF